MNNSENEYTTHPQYTECEFSNSNIRQSIIGPWRDSFKNIIFIFPKKKFHCYERERTKKGEERQKARHERIQHSVKAVGNDEIDKNLQIFRF